MRLPNSFRSRRTAPAPGGPPGTCDPGGSRGATDAPVGRRAHRRAPRWAAALAGLVAGAGCLAAPAGAHVVVDPAEGAPGEYVRIAFRVPNESATASTTKIDVYLPEDLPTPFVSVMPVPGWGVEVRRRSLDKPIKTEDGEVSEVVAQITWTAAPDAGLKSGQFVEFPVSLGPLPHADELVFKTLQTYSDGAVTRWIELPGPDGKAPEHPAPTLRLAKGAGADSEGTGSSETAAPGGAGHDGLAVALGGAGLAAGVLGVGLGAVALRRARRAPAGGAGGG